MKKIYKNSLSVALSTLVCVFLALPASAQRQSTGGGGGSSSGGGGSSRSSGGGGSSASSSRPSGGGGGGVRPAGGARSAGGNVGVSRPSGNAYPHSGGYNGAVQHGTGAPRGAVYVDRQGNVIHNNYAPRTGVAATGVSRVGVVTPSRGATAGGISGYRTSPQVGYGGYWGNHGYYHYNHGYYGSYYLPRLGFTIGVLPYGYYPFYFGDYQYYYSDGLFYQYENSQYTVVEPPVGAELTTLPNNAQSIVINGQQYYELNGVYYQPVTKDDGTIVYQVAGKDGQLNTTDSTVQDDQQQGPQMGDIVTQLPPNCRKIKVNGSKLYVSADGIYYQEVVDPNGGITYKIVGLPSDEPDQN